MYMPQYDSSFLNAALEGYELRRGQLQSAIDELTAKLGGRRGAVGKASVGGQPMRRRKPLSAAARKRIAAAQRKRWAAVHARERGVARKAAPKRKLSPAARAKPLANLKKARAARTAKRKAAAA